MLLQNCTNSSNSRDSQIRERIAFARVMYVHTNVEREERRKTHPLGRCVDGRRYCFSSLTFAYYAYGRLRDHKSSGEQLMADRRPFIVLRDRASLFFRCENRNRGDAELSSNSKVRNLRKDARRATGATVIGL